MGDRRLPWIRTRKKNQAHQAQQVAEARLPGGVAGEKSAAKLDRPPPGPAGIVIDEDGQGQEPEKSADATQAAVQQAAEQEDRLEHQVRRYLFGPDVADAERDDLRQLYARLEDAVGRLQVAARLVTQDPEAPIALKQVAHGAAQAGGEIHTLVARLLGPLLEVVIDASGTEALTGDLFSEAVQTLPEAERDGFVAQWRDAKPTDLLQLADYLLDSVRRAGWHEEKAEQLLGAMVDTLPPRIVTGTLRSRRRASTGPTGGADPSSWPPTYGTPRTREAEGHGDAG